MSEITQLLSRVNQDEKVWDDLMPLVYAELKNMARQRLNNERSNHTLNPTALVHESFFRLVEQNQVEWVSRSHFLAIASLAMKRVLLNYAKERGAQKRKTIRESVSLDGLQPLDLQNLSDAHLPQLLRLGDGLKQLEKEDEKSARIVEYRFFGGLNYEEIAEVTGTSAMTVRRKWMFAKTWLKMFLNQA